MRRTLAWTVAIIAIAALARWLRGRALSARTASAEPVADPADELRRALEQSRADQGLEPEVTAGEASIEERRAHVHARAESAIARMREGDG
jgi:hypothetical protein